jgi:hypothetical protein
MNYHIIGQCSIRSAAALRRPRCGSGHAATLPRLCRPGPALAEPLGPDLFRLGDRHHPGAAPAVPPHPDVHLVEPAAVAPVPLRVGGGVSQGTVEEELRAHIPRQRYWLHPHPVGEGLQPLQPPELS